MSTFGKFLKDRRLELNVEKSKILIFRRNNKKKES